MWSKGHRLLPRGAAHTRWMPHVTTSAPLRSRPDAPLLTNLLGDALLVDEAPADEGPTVEHQLAEAHARGVTEGRALAEHAMADERARIAATVREIAGLRRRVLDAAEHDVMQLAVGMARRVLHREVQLDPDILLSMAHVALGRLGDRPVATAHLHPDDLAAVHQPSAVAEGLTLVGDADVPRGGCRLVTAGGEVDLGVDAQMTELSRVLLGELSSVEHVQLH
jgi:flagellar assembly protein FliH